MAGRAPMPSEKRRSVMRGVRLRRSVGARLFIAAQANGNSQSEEAAIRIERSFDAEELEAALRRIIAEELRRIFKRADGA